MTPSGICTRYILELKKQKIENEWFFIKTCFLYRQWVNVVLYWYSLCAITGAYSRALFISQYKKVATFCNSRLPLYWVLAVLRHIPIQGHEFQYKVTIFSNSKLPLYWVLAVLRLIPIQDHKSKYTVTIFCNWRLILYWSIVLVKCTYYVIKVSMFCIPFILPYFKASIALCYLASTDKTCASLVLLV